MKNIEPKTIAAPSTTSTSEWDQFTRQAAIVILILSVLFLLSVMRPLINLLGITGIFILVLSYPVNSLRKKTHRGYTFAVLAVFIPLAIILFLIFSNLTSWFVNNVQALTGTLNGVVAQNPLAVAKLDNILGGEPYIKQLVEYLTTNILRSLRFMAEFITAVSLALFLAFLFIMEMPANISRSFHAISGGSQREFGILVNRLSDVWNGWLRSTVITSLIVGAATGLELYLLGIPYAGILGVITGLLNLVPTFGPIISYLLIIVVTYTQGSTKLALDPITLTILVWGLNLAINQVARLVIFPRLAGKAVHLPVFFVILGLVVAAVLWGVVGVILVVPLLGTVREVLYYVLRKINRQDPYPGEQLVPGFWANTTSKD